MPVLKPSLGKYYVKWLDSRYFKSVAALQCYSTHCFLSEAQLVRLMVTEPRSVGYVVTTVRNDPLAFILFRPHPEDQMSHFIDLVVHPDHRRRGLGRLLVSRMKSASTDAECILAKTGEQNTLAHVFLKEMGFVAYHVWRGEGQEDEEAYCFIYSRNQDVVEEACRK